MHPLMSFRLCLLGGLLLPLTGCTSPKPPPPAFHPVAESPAPLDTNPQDVAILNRVSWGANTAGAQAVAAQGIVRYLEAQLHPSADDHLPPDAMAQIAAMSITQKPMSEIAAEIRADRARVKDAKGSDDAKTVRKAYQLVLAGYAREAATRSLLRDLYSTNQLKEQLTWFWFNHFNVSQKKADIRAFIGDYEENAIRPHVLGHFRDLLMATAFHPAMLLYLDNAQNAVGHINENYAREVMELHTMGVGSGYTQKDVQELARILTGVGINLRGAPLRRRRGLRGDFVERGVFEFNPNRHDYGTKIFLGQTIHGTGLDEVYQALDLLSREPATAHHISLQLATYFVSDNPPPALVDNMAATFSASDGDIAAVLATMFHSPEFTASLNGKFKDPIHYAISALRATYGDTVILNPQPLLNWLNRMGEGLYMHETPDGYPLTQAAWCGPGEMETRFEIARQVGQGHSGLFRLPDATGPEPAPTPHIQQTHYYAAIAPTLGASTIQALAQAKTPADWNMLFLASPPFMQH
jgi:uncharacterized protein (DUF1800 family)